MSTQPRPGPTPPEEPVRDRPVVEDTWGIQGQWGALMAGAFAGFAAFILMAVLGLAIGITAGEPLTLQEAGIVSGLWWIVTLLATGMFAGWVLGATARADRTYNAAIYGTVTWIVGTLIMLLLLAFGVGNIIGGVGGAVGQVMAGRPLPAAEDVEIAGVAASTAWVLFASMVIGLGATILGGWLGSPSRTERAGWPRLER